MLVAPIKNRLSGRGRENDDIMGLRVDSRGGNVNSTYVESI